MHKIYSKKVECFHSQYTTMEDTNTWEIGNLAEVTVSYVLKKLNSDLICQDFLEILSLLGHAAMKYEYFWIDFRSFQTWYTLCFWCFYSLRIVPRLYCLYFLQIDANFENLSNQFPAIQNTRYLYLQDVLFECSGSCWYSCFLDWNHSS